jgi:hypothetical protein
VGIDYFLAEEGDYEFFLIFDSVGTNRLEWSVDFLNNNTTDVQRFSARASLLVTITVPGGMTTSMIKPLI